MRYGAAWRKLVVYLNCRSHDGPNLWITDAAVLPTSAAVNPDLTMAALALKSASAIASELEHAERPRNADAASQKPRSMVPR